MAMAASSAASLLRPLTAATTRGVVSSRPALLRHPSASLTCCHVASPAAKSSLLGGSSFSGEILKSLSNGGSHGRLQRRRVTTAAMAAAEGGGSPPKVGFLGLGIMGVAMARNLVNAGYSVTVWNRTESKCQPLVDIGALKQSSPQAVAESCDITFAMLADPESAMEVACGEAGVVKGLASGKGYVDVSTVDLDTAKAICAAVKQTGAEFLEAPVSGSKKPAEDGTLIFLTAGDRPLFDRASPLLDVMGKSKFYLGEVGNGAAMKLVVNMVMGSMMASFSEGLALGAKAGLDPSTILEVVGQGAIAAPMYGMKGPSMLKGTFPPAFPLKHQQKDLRLALALAREVGQSLPVAAAANGVFLEAREAGFGESDFSAVIEVVKALRDSE